MKKISIKVTEIPFNYSQPYFFGFGSNLPVKARIQLANITDDVVKSSKIEA